MGFIDGVMKEKKESMERMRDMVDMGFYYGALVENISSVGGALMAGKLWLSRAYPSNPNEWVSIFTHWNSLMGDPATQLWTSSAKELIVNHNDEILNGSDNFQPPEKYHRKISINSFEISFL